MKYRIVASILILALLSSCAAVVIVGAATGIAVYDRRSIPSMERDARIFYMIRQAIVADPRFSGSRIVVSSYNQVVLLAGQTSQDSLRAFAEKIAQKTPNVRRVYDEITLGHPISWQQKNMDTWITGQVRSKLVATKGLESGSIHIVTEQQTVYLMGVVTHEQANLAVYAARQIEGVSKVVKIFQYIA